jgi:hypothetical protein
VPGELPIGVFDTILTEIKDDGADPEDAIADEPISSS